jgi:hypothetical protein
MMTTQLFALKVTVTSPLGDFSGLVTEPSEDYQGTCNYRDGLITAASTAGFGTITLIDGQVMTVVPECLVQESAVSFEVIDATP